MCSASTILLNYFYIPTIIVVVLLGVFILYSNYNKITGKLFFALTVVISLWLLFNLLNFASTDIEKVLLYDKLSIIGVFIAPIFFAFLYFFSDDSHPEKIIHVSRKKILLFFAPLIPFIFLSSTKYNIQGLTPSPECETIAGPLYWLTLIVTIFYIVSSLIIFFQRIKFGSSLLKKQLRIILFGFIFATVWALMTNVILQFFGIQNASLLAPVGVLFLVTSVSYAMVNYGFLSIKLIGTQALVVALLFFIGALLFVKDFKIMRFVIGVTLTFAGIFGYMLIKSVKIEIRQKENLQIANKKILSRERQLKKVSESLKVANEKLKEIDAAKTDFIQVAAHQLNKVPTPLKGYLSLLLEGSYGKLSDEQQEVLVKINSANERQIRLVGDLLNVARLESGKFRLNFTKEHLEGICGDVYAATLPAAKERGLKLTYDNPKEPLPELILDKGKIFEAVFNFVDNAIKYTKEGSVDLKIELDPESHYKPLEKTDIDNNNQSGKISGPVVRVTVADTGMGIAKENIPYLFAKFSRKDKASLNSEGTGLGLYVVKLMIEAHGGRTWAESRGEGEGSKFIIEIPTVQPKNVAIENAGNK